MLIKQKNGERVAIVAGLRTPFARQWTELKSLTAIEMGTLVVNGLLNRAEVDPKIIDQVVFGQVIPAAYAPNIAREIVISSNLDISTDAYSVSRACATSFQALISAAESIQSGQISSAIVGGADTSSILPISLSDKLARCLMASQKAKRWRGKVAAFRGLSFSELLPVPPSVAEYSTGLTMGDTAEQMAKSHHISREDQDDFAHRSHQLASNAWREGKITDEVLPIYAKPYHQFLDHDNNVRQESQRDSYRRLQPVFDKQFGTVTAGNSSALTDGAAAMMVMSERRAKSLGLPIVGLIKSYAFSANPVDIDMLAGPAYSTPVALERAGMALNDIDVVEMHEAFSAQVLTVLRLWESTQFAKDRLNRSNAIGAVDWDKFNVLGGSLAYGHPFAATGSRMVVQLLTELNRRGGGVGLATACAAGGLGVTVIVEAENG
jgi:acetyl-CoA acyltransferase